MLKIDNLFKTFNDKKILNNVSLEVKKGEIALLLGSSGVGKSTLLRILNNLETIDAGTISLNNQLLDLKTVNVTHVTGMVFQHFNLFEHLTVEENITLSLEHSLHKSKSEAKKIAHTFLKMYGLENKTKCYISQLSGGQKQRVALARALALQPQIICLDEPTSALDPLLTNHVADIIQQLATDNYIVLIASHDIALLDKLDCTIYLMTEGRIVESVHSAQFKDNPKKYPHIHKFVMGHI